MITDINQIKTDGTFYNLTFIPYGYRLHHDEYSYVSMNDPDYDKDPCKFSFENAAGGGFYIKNTAGHYLGIVSNTNKIGSWSSPFSWSIFSEGNYQGKNYAYFSIRKTNSTTDYINYPPNTFDNAVPIYLISSNVITDTDFKVHDFFAIELAIPDNIVWNIESGDLDYDLTQFQNGGLDSLPVDCFAQQNLYNTTTGGTFSSEIEYSTSQTSTITWQLNEELNINASIQLELKIPFIGDISETASIKADVASNQEWSTETEIGYHIAAPLEVDSKVSYQAILAISWGSNLSIPYTIPLLVTAEANGVTLTGQQMADILETTKSTCKINSIYSNSISVSLSGIMYSSYGLQTSLTTNNAPVPNTNEMMALVEIEN